MRKKLVAGLLVFASMLMGCSAKTGNMSFDPSDIKTDGAKAVIEKEIAERSDSEDAVKEDDDALIIGGVPVMADFSKFGEVTRNKHLVCVYPKDMSISYMDSYIRAGDEQAVTEKQESLQAIHGVPVKSESFEQNDQTGYMLSYEDFSGLYVKVYEPIPEAETYLEINIADLNKEYDAATLKDMYVLDI